MNARRPLHVASTGRALPSALVLATNVALFGFGTFMWVFKLSGNGVSLLPVSPLQLGLLGFAAVALLAILQSWGLRPPHIVRRSWSARLTNLAVVLVITGTLFPLAANPAYRSDALMYLLRWSLPWGAMLTFFLTARLGGDRRFVVYGIVAGCLLTVVVCEADRRGLPMPVFKMPGGSRYAGLLLHPNQYGILLGSTAPFLIYLFHRGRTFDRALAIGGIALYAIGLFQCMSKTNIALFPVALALTALLYSLESVGRFARTLTAIAVWGVVSACLMGVALQLVQSFSPREFERMEQFITNPAEVDTLAERENAWGEVREVLSKSWLFGKGPGWTEDNLMYTHAHNMYLQLWLEAGLLGLLGVLSLTLAVLARCGEVFALLRRRVPVDDDLRFHTAAALSLLFALFGNSMSSSLHTATMIPFCVVLALALVAPDQTPFRFGPRPRARRAPPLRAGPRTPLPHVAS